MNHILKVVNNFEGRDVEWHVTFELGSQKIAETAYFKHKLV